MVRADYQKKPLVAGLTLSGSAGRDQYSGIASGQVNSAVTGVYPWLGYQASEGVRVWGAAGYGRQRAGGTPRAQTARPNSRAFRFSLTYHPSVARPSMPLLVPPSIGL